MDCEGTGALNVGEEENVDDGADEKKDCTLGEENNDDELEDNEGVTVGVMLS